MIEGEETPSYRLHAIMGYFQGNYVVINMFMGQSTYLMKLNYMYYIIKTNFCCPIFV